MDMRIPRYQWGQRVRALSDLYNDGSYPECPSGALLVREGDCGEIVQVGTHVETGTPVYLIEFRGGKSGGASGGTNVVGCLEEEIGVE